MGRTSTDEGGRGADEGEVVAGKSLAVIRK